jgi:hypothetical protein
MPEDQAEVDQAPPLKEVKKPLGLDEIVEIVDDGEYEQARDQFLEQRLTELQSAVEPKEFTVFSPPYKGFIHPDSEIKPTAFLDGFKLDDNDIYADLVDNVRAFKQDDRWKSKSIREINPYAVLKTLGGYFGNYAADAGLEGRHHSYYMDHSSVDSEALPLVELKGKGIAMCTEKAAATQNLVSLLGYESEFCLSQGCELVEGSEEMHAFNVLSSDRGRFIFEPANPIFVSNADGNVVNFLPATYKLTEEQYGDLMSGGEVGVQHTDFRVVDGKYEKQEVEVRKYAGLGKNTL